MLDTGRACLWVYLGVRGWALRGGGLMEVWCEEVASCRCYAGRRRERCFGRHVEKHATQQSESMQTHGIALRTRPSRFWP